MNRPMEGDKWNHPVDKWRLFVVLPVMRLAFFVIIKGKSCCFCSPDPFETVPDPAGLVENLSGNLIFVIN